MIFDDEIYAKAELNGKTPQEAASEGPEMEEALEQMHEEYMKNLYAQQYELLKDIKRLSRETLIYQKYEKGEETPKGISAVDYKHSEYLLNAAENDLRINKFKIEAEFAKFRKQKPQLYIVTDEEFIGDESTSSEPEENKLN